MAGVLVVVVAFIAMSSGSSGAAAVGISNETDVVWVAVDQPVADDVRAVGTILLTPTLQTIEEKPRQVRVMSRWINISKEGCHEKVTFKGTPYVDPGTRAAVENQVRTVPSDRPMPGDENLPSKCLLRIQPREGFTWGSVTDAAHLDIHIEWEGA